MADVKITPESAIDHVDEIAAKYHGTRDDHKVLEASIGLLRKVIGDWRLFQQAKAAGLMAKAKDDDKAPEDDDVPPAIELVKKNGTAKKEGRKS